MTKITNQAVQTQTEHRKHFQILALSYCTKINIAF